MLLRVALVARIVYNWKQEQPELELELDIFEGNVEFRIPMRARDRSRAILHSRTL